MTPEEAIKILEDEVVDVEQPPWGTIREAIKLGIEALKRINYMRDLGDVVATEPLPGETDK